MGNGEIARYEQFLLFPQCFQKACFLLSSKGGIVWEWVNGKHTQMTNYVLLMMLGFVLERVENIVLKTRKGWLDVPGMFSKADFPLGGKCSPLFRRWSFGKAASGLERVLCVLLVNPLPHNATFRRTKDT